MIEWAMAEGIDPLNCSMGVSDALGTGQRSQLCSWSLETQEGCGVLERESPYSLSSGVEWKKVTSYIIMTKFQFI